MRIQILDEAQDDLIQGFQFYEGREGGRGTYVLDCALPTEHGFRQLKR